jgi:DNA-binding NtrC family response regulator
MKRIVVVEDRETTRRMVEETLRRRGYVVEGAGTVLEGRALLDAEPAPDFLLTDLQLPDGSGLDLLAHALGRDGRLPVIVMSAFGTIEIAVEAVKNGAYDFVPKPFDNNKLVELVARALERRARAVDAGSGAVDADDPMAGSGIHGTSEVLRDVVRRARRVAPSDATVLLLGESGTGKELIAQAIHRWSGRSGGPLVTVNCAAVPGELMEAEFFGSERGAFTGSVARKLGKVELAGAGTLFLDEIGELPPGMQAKLLRVLQERTFSRIGGSEEIHSDIRVIAATNRELAARVHDGSFREDLFYRLNVFPIRLPSLRERPGDVEPLAAAFVAEEAGKHSRPGLRLGREAADVLRQADWPGNVRQLRNVIERAAILAEGDEIGPEHFEDVERRGASAGAGELLPAGVTLKDVGKEAARRAEMEAIRHALEGTKGNKTEAARRLGVSYKTLWSKLKEYELE